MFDLFNIKFSFKIKKKKINRHSFLDGARNNGQRCVIPIPHKRPPLLSSRRRAPNSKKKQDKLLENSEFMRLVEEEEKSNISNKEKQTSIVSERIKASVDSMPSEFEANERKTIGDGIREIQSVVNIQEPLNGITKGAPPYIEISQPEAGILQNDRRFAATLLDNIRRAAKSGRLGFTSSHQKRYGMPFDNCELSNQCIDGAKCARKAGRSYFCLYFKQNLFKRSG